MRALYTALHYLVVPFILARLYWRSRKNPAYGQRIAERFGYYTAPPPLGEVLWIHAVSVGEVESAVPLVKALGERHPDLPILFTSTTPTGSSRVLATFGAGVQHCYLPYDLPGCVQRFLGHFQPRIAVILETEIWPNLFHRCAARSIPLLIVNGRLSGRSTKGYAKIRRLVRETLRHLSAISAQTEDDAQRFGFIGADPDIVTTTGNIKFDLEIPVDAAQQGRSDREDLFPARLILAAASTHEGEERRLLQCFAELRRKFPTLLLLLVPRHPERFPEVARLCRELGYRVVLRSEGRACHPDDQVFLLDTMGELRRFYAAADVAFVGGSLVPVGGHNVLEPAAVGVPVLYGPHVGNFREICAALEATGGGHRCEDAAAVADFAARLLASDQARNAMGEQGRRFVESNRGALARVISLLERYLPTAVGRAGGLSAAVSSSNGAGRPIK